MDKELGKIRKKYTSDKAMTGAGRRKDLAFVALFGCSMLRGGLDSCSIQPCCYVCWLLPLHAMRLLPCLPALTLTPPPPLLCAAYDKRKYMWKLLYTRLLGYDVDFGVKNASDLIAAPGCACAPLHCWGRRGSRAAGFAPTSAAELAVSS